MAGIFIAFEGPEGAGKSTQLRHLGARLEAEGLETLVTKEPGGTPVGERIRHIVLLEPDLEISPMTEFLLYSASRAEHVASVIRPALEAGRIVVCDRFAGASVAYQGYGRGLPLDFVGRLTDEVTGSLEPDLTLLFDLDPEVGLARVAARGQKDRLEQADLEFHRRVREGFLAQARAHPDWLTFDATRSEDELQEEVWRALKTYLNLHDAPHTHG